MEFQIASHQSQKPIPRIVKLHQRIPDRIGIRLANTIEFIRLDTIVCCEAWSNYCRIHTSDRKEPILLSKTLKYVSAFLPENTFYRTHQSFIIRIDVIRSVGDNIVLSNGMSVPLSRRHKTDFMTWLDKNITLI
jgi:two-component system LytT family response regulator